MLLPGLGDVSGLSVFIKLVCHCPTPKDPRDDLLSRVSGLLCRAGGQDDDYSQLFAEDVTGHSFLSTKTGCVIDLAQNPAYVILGLGCTKSMVSRYAVNKITKANHVHGLDYRIIPATSRFSLANSETTSVHQYIILQDGVKAEC